VSLEDSINATITTGHFRFEKRQSGICLSTYHVWTFCIGVKISHPCIRSRRIGILTTDGLTHVEKQDLDGLRISRRIDIR